MSTESRELIERACRLVHMHIGDMPEGLDTELMIAIDAAIKRIHAGTYGICEITQKPISKDRLLAVPFTRHSAEAQTDIERNRYRARTAGGLFGEGEEGGKIASDDGGGGDD